MEPLLKPGQSRNETPADVEQTAWWLLTLLALTALFALPFTFGCAPVKAAIVPESEMRRLTGN